MSEREHYLPAQLLVTEKADGELILTILAEPDEGVPERIQGALDKFLNQYPDGFPLSPELKGTVR